MSATRTHTYNTIEFADPFKQCVICGAWVDGVLCIPDESWPNLPCHHVGYIDRCASWGPVDGCMCDRLGWPKHTRAVSDQGGTEK